MSQLEALSTELMVQVLSNLSSTKEIVRARATCSRLRQVIDEPSNTDALVRTLRSRKLTEIHDFVATHVFFGENKPLHHAVADILNHRGIWPRIYDRIPDCLTIATIWVSNQPDEFPKPDPQMMRSAPGYCVSRLIECILELHLQHHELRFGLPKHTIELQHREQHFVNAQAEEKLFDRDIFVRRIQRLDQMGIGTTMYFEQVYDDIVATPVDGVNMPGNLTSAPLHYHPSALPGTTLSGAEASPIFAQRDPARRALTKFAYRPPCSVIKNGACTREWCAQQFELPLMPKKSLSYCVRSEWAFTVVEAAIREGTALEGFVRAALLDEIFVY